METKIIKAVFGGGTSTVTNKRTRTDYGQVLEIIGIDLPDTFECIFSNSATSAGVGKKQIGSAQRVLIPDEYLTTGQTIYAWILLHDTEDDGRHMYSIRIPVADMPDTSPEEPTPVEQSVISQAIAALNSAVDTTTQKAQEAADSADRAEQAAEGTESYAERAEAAQSASESARDIALEAKVSAQTSAATASEKASEAISSATTASQSAIDAEQESERAKSFAESSAQSAQGASQFASVAGTSAYDASESAQTASSKASEASQKASEAAQSAQAAVQAKTDAETAKTASQTAQGLAESARDEAVSAKTGAESARAEAQDIVDGITGKVEQIDSNTDRIESLEDDRYKPYAVDSASGSIASFPDGADDIPLKSCIVHVEPVQEGSGDPSPENERPITGWTGCEVQRTGKNLFDINWLEAKDSIFLVDGVASGTAYDFHIVHNTGIQNTKNFKPSTMVLSFYAYTDGNSTTTGNGLQFDVIYNDGTVSRCTIQNSETSPKKFVLNIEAKLVKYFRTTYSRASLNIWHISDVQLELGSTPTPYEPYKGRTYPITFPASAGTVYGGYVDVTGGELVVDRAQIASYNGETLPSTWISDRDVYASGTTPTISAQVVYKLAEPIHYPLTPTEIKTMLGTNNIWSNTGDVSVEYRADVKLYINKKIAEAISALS